MSQLHSHSSAVSSPCHSPFIPGYQMIFASSMQPSSLAPDVTLCPMTKCLTMHHYCHSIMPSSSPPGRPAGRSPFSPAKSNCWYICVYHVLAVCTYDKWCGPSTPQTMGRWCSGARVAGTSPSSPPPSLTPRMPGYWMAARDGTTERAPPPGPQRSDVTGFVLGEHIRPEHDPIL